MSLDYLKPFALSLSKGHSWFDKAFSPERSRRVTTNGLYGDSSK